MIFTTILKMCITKYLSIHYSNYIFVQIYNIVRKSNSRHNFYDFFLNFVLQLWVLLILRYNLSLLYFDVTASLCFNSAIVVLMTSFIILFLFNRTSNIFLKISLISSFLLHKIESCFSGNFSLLMAKRYAYSKLTTVLGTWKIFLVNSARHRWHDKSV